MKDEILKIIYDFNKAAEDVAKIDLALHIKKMRGAK